MRYDLQNFSTNIYVDTAAAISQVGVFDWNNTKFKSLDNQSGTIRKLIATTSF